MAAQIYTKAKRRNFRKPLRFLGLGLALLGFAFGLYTLSPLISWELYLKPAFASNRYASPIPQTTIMTEDVISSLLRNSLRGGDWLPSIYNNADITSSVSRYTLDIPKLKIKIAEVSTTDTDISSHLVHFPGTAMPPTKGNAVIFGHSTLPQLYDPKNYRTIFANIHNLTIGDDIHATITNTRFTYKVISMTIVDADDTTYLTQPSDDSYLTIVTCTPPGTVWKRLIVKSRLEKI